MLKYSIATFAFNGNSVPAKIKEDGNTSWNFTAMAKIFGKEPSEWLSNKNTEALIDAVIADSDSNSNSGNSRDSLFEVGKGCKGGTWCNNELLTIEFAGWLSPAFKVWTLKQIRDLSHKGYVNLTKESLIDLQTAQIVEAIRDGKSFGKQLKRLMNDINYDEHCKGLDIKFTKSALEKIIRGLSGNINYDYKNNFFQRLDVNFTEWALDNQNMCSRDEANLISKFIADEHLNYRGRVIGQRSRVYDPEMKD